MAFSTQTKLNATTIESDGTILARFEKIVLSDDVVVSSKWHRVTIAPGDDLASVVASNSANLVSMGFPAINDADSAKLASYRSV